MSYNCFALTQQLVVCASGEHTRYVLYVRRRRGHLSSAIGYEDPGSLPYYTAWTSAAPRRFVGYLMIVHLADWTWAGVRVGPGAFRPT